MAQRLRRQGRLLRQHHRRTSPASPRIRGPGMGRIQAPVCGALHCFALADNFSLLLGPSALSSLFSRLS